MHREVSSTNKDEADKYIAEFAKYVEIEGFNHNIDFNCDETPFFFKCLIEHSVQKMKRHYQTTSQ